MPSPEFVIPIRAGHVRSALTIARQDPDSFRQEEMSWLEEHNPYLWNHFKELFEATVRTKGIDSGSAVLLGDNLGSRAVRLCIDEEGMDYEIAKQNFMRNFEEDVKNEGINDAAWDDEDALNRVFGNPDLTASIMEVRHSVARDGAAVTIGFLCLATIPEPKPVN